MCAVVVNPPALATISTSGVFAIHVQFAGNSDGHDGWLAPLTVNCQLSPPT